MRRRTLLASLPTSRVATVAFWVYLTLFFGLRVLAADTPSPLDFIGLVLCLTACWQGAVGTIQRMRGDDQ